MSEQACRALVNSRAGGRCERCGGIGQSYHHRLKRSQGGEWDCSNIVLVCGHGTKGCHGWIEDHPDAAERDGWHVRPWEDPEEVGVKLLRSHWVLLLPNGDTSETTGRDEMAPEGGELLPGRGEEDGPDPVQAPDEAERTLWRPE